MSRPGQGADAAASLPRRQAVESPGVVVVDLQGRDAVSLDAVLGTGDLMGKAVRVTIWRGRDDEVALPDAALRTVDGVLGPLLCEVLVHLSPPLGEVEIPRAQFLDLNARHPTGIGVGKLPLSCA